MIKPDIFEMVQRTPMTELEFMVEVAGVDAVDRVGGDCRAGVRAACAGSAGRLDLVLLYVLVYVTDPWRVLERRPALDVVVSSR